MMDGDNLLVAVSLQYSLHTFSREGVSHYWALQLLVVKIYCESIFRNWKGK